MLNPTLLISVCLSSCYTRKFHTVASKRVLYYLLRSDSKVYHVLCNAIWLILEGRVNRHVFLTNLAVMTILLLIH